MTREEIIERKRIAHQLRMIEAMGWKKDEVEFRNK